MECGNPTTNMSLLSYIPSVSTPTNFIKDTSLLVECVGGFNLADGQKIVRTNCTSSGAWTPLPDCVGISFIYKYANWTNNVN